MANRVGTFLSDDNIRTRCPDKFPAPAGKSRYVFSTSDLEGPDRTMTLTQRPVNPGAMFRELSQKGFDGDAVRLKYHERLLQDFTHMDVIEPPQSIAGINQMMSPSPRASTGRIMAARQAPPRQSEPAASSSGTPARGNEEDPLGLAAPSKRERQGTIGSLVTLARQLSGGRVRVAPVSEKAKGKQRMTPDKSILQDVMSDVETAGLTSQTVGRMTRSGLSGGPRSGEPLAGLIRTKLGLKRATGIQFQGPKPLEEGDAPLISLQ